MKKIQPILRGAASVFNFNFNINGNYTPPELFDLEELPTLRSPGEAIASYWQTTGDYLRSAMNQIQMEEYGNDAETEN